MGIPKGVITLALLIAISSFAQEPAFFSKAYQQPVEFIQEVLDGPLRNFYVDVQDPVDTTQSFRQRRTFQLFRTGYSGFPFKLWIDTALSGNAAVQPKVDTLLNFLANQTPDGSKNPNLGIGTLLHQWVGTVPNQFPQGNADTVHYLVTDVNYAARGWFSPMDQKDTDKSNKGNILYLNWRNFGTGTVAEIAGTAAHELVHLIEHRYDPQEERFSLEGRAQMGEYICGFQWDEFVNSFVTALPAYKRRGILQFADFSREDAEITYGRAALFYKYCLEQYGDTLLRYLVQNPLSGRAGIDSALRQVGADRSFVELVRDFWIALWVQDRNVDPRWGFQYQLKRRPFADKSFSAYETEFDSTDIALLSEYEAAYVDFSAAARILRFLERQDSVVVKQVLHTVPKKVIGIALTEPSLTPSDVMCSYVVVNLGTKKLYDCKLQSRSLDSAHFLGNGALFGSNAQNVALLWGNARFASVVPTRGDDIFCLLYRADLRNWKVQSLLFAGVLYDTVNAYSINPPQRALTLGDVVAGNTGIAWVVSDHQVKQLPGWVQDSTAAFINYEDDRLRYGWQWEPHTAFPSRLHLLGVANRRIWWTDEYRDTLYVGDVDTRSIQSLALRPTFTLWTNEDFHLDGSVMAWRRSYRGSDSVQIVVWGPNHPYTVLAEWNHPIADARFYDILDHQKGRVVWRLPDTGRVDKPDTLVVFDYRSRTEQRIVSQAPSAAIHRARLFGNTLVWTEIVGLAPNEKIHTITAYDLTTRRVIRQWSFPEPVEAEWWIVPQALTASGLWCLIRIDTMENNDRSYQTRIYQLSWDRRIRRRAAIAGWTPNDDQIHLIGLDGKANDVLVPVTDSSCVVELFPAKAQWDDPATTYHPGLWYVPLQRAETPAEVAEHRDYPAFDLSINPSVNDGRFTICWSVLPQSSGTATVSIYDAQMRLLWKQHVDIRQRCFQPVLPMLSNGMYVCQFRYGTTTVVQPFFVRR